MPKRPNPFGDGSPLQMKTHVGNREINLLGFDGDKNMQTVYEKTRQLLFTGARKRIDQIIIDANENSPAIPNQNMTGQMCLDKMGQIVPPCGTLIVQHEHTAEDGGMDIDSTTVDTHSNKKISDFFTIKRKV